MDLVRARCLRSGIIDKLTPENLSNSQIVAGLEPLAPPALSARQWHPAENVCRSRQWRAVSPSRPKQICSSSEVVDA